MRFILQNCDDDDIKTLETHLFSRQWGVLIKENSAYVYVDIVSPYELPFVASILKCQFLLVPNDFSFKDKVYSVLKIVRENNDRHDQNSGDGVLPKEQVV